MNVVAATDTPATSAAAEPLVAGSLGARVERALAPILAHDGFDLVWVEYLAHGKILRLYIDHAEGVTLDHCSQVSRTVSDLLDAEAATVADIAGAYTLEVSSPGLDRPLVRPAHFARFCGRQIRLVSRGPLAGQPPQQRTHQGILRAADADGIVLVVDQVAIPLAYDAFDRARLVPEL